MGLGLGIGLHLRASKPTAAGGDSDPVSPPEWVPLDDGAIAWFEASDANNVTLTGSLVDQWDDLSGGGNHVAQATATNKPTYDGATNIIDGKAVVSFDGTDNYLTKMTTSGFPSCDTGILVLAVARFRATNSRALFDVSPDTNTNKGVLAFCDGGNINLRTSFENNPAAAAFSDTTNPHVWSFLGQTANRVIWKGGVSQDTDTNNNNFNNALTNLRIGSLWQDVFWLLGDIGEMIFFSGDASSAVREKAEGYLAHRWGLEGNLDAGHPYKAAPP